MIDWANLSTTKEDYKLIHKAAARRCRMAIELGVQDDITAASMDIQIVHHNNPLRLQELLDAPDHEFSHDVFGIRKFINRDSGALGGLFVPRYSV